MEKQRVEKERRRDGGGQKSLKKKKKKHPNKTSTSIISRKKLISRGGGNLSRGKKMSFPDSRKCSRPRIKKAKGTSEARLVTQIGNEALGGFISDKKIERHRQKKKNKKAKTHHKTTHKTHTQTNINTHTKPVDHASSAKKRDIGDQPKRIRQ